VHRTGFHAIGRDRVIVITGASSGIGQACAIYLDKNGFRVFAGVRKEADGIALQRKSGSRLTPLLLNVTDSKSIAAALQSIAIAIKEDGLYGLVNNAGVAHLGPLELLPISHVRLQLEVNVVGTVAVTQAFLPLLRAGKGRIINIGSVSGLCALPFASSYAASKFALEALTDSLRVELRPWKIPVSIVEPGNVATPIWDKGLAAADEMLRAAPEPALSEAKELYDPVMEFLRRRAETPCAMPPERVARVVAHALTVKRPQARYSVGSGTRVLKLLGVLPPRLRDWLIATQLPHYG
jgi:NAD(P)-dependent dehydrogenase (short-subunit alcohol dehydrogenase family)